MHINTSILIELSSTSKYLSHVPNFQRSIPLDADENTIQWVQNWLKTMSGVQLPMVHYENKKQAIKRWSRPGTIQHSQ